MYELSVVVAPEDIDQQGHVNNIAYLKFVQDIAVAHWYAAASREDTEKLSWVVVRHEIDYKAQAFLGEELTVRTWVGNAGRLKFERHTEVFRGAKLLVRALTIWCPIDRATGKPTAPSDAVRESFSAK